MKVQSALDTPQYAPCIYKNRTTGELERGQYNLTEMMEKAKENHDARLRELAAAKKTLTPAEIDELAEKLYKQYDPQHMTQKDYDSFINALIEGGALTSAETHGMCFKNMDVIDPYESLRSWEIRSPLDEVSRLSDVNGDAMLFLYAIKDRDRGGAQSNKAHARATRKALSVLDAMLYKRKQEGISSVSENTDSWGIESWSFSWSKITMKTRMQNSGTPQTAVSKTSLISAAVSALLEKIHREYNPQKIAQDEYERYIDKLLAAL